MKTFLPFVPFVYLVVCIFSSSVLVAGELLDFESPPVNYSSTEPDNVLSQLQADLDSGKRKLTFDPGYGYLRGLLKELKIPVSSQMLVYARSSAQRALIHPENPRAVYFGDDAYLAVVPGGFIELIVPDEQLGLAFYKIEQEPEKPQLSHQISRCMTCHSSSRTRNIPGLQARSMVVDPKGRPVFAAGSFRTSQASPLSERWGGWYVTGTHGDATHLGNFHLPDSRRPKKPVQNTTGLNVKTLAGRLDTSRYLSPHSDIAALMVFEHQIDVHNQLSRVQYAWRIARHTGKPDAYWQAESERLLEQMLFTDEARLKAPVRGTSGFTGEFARRGPHDARGRSLRQLNLKTRLFEYPCSYMIYSDSFAMLPKQVKKHFYRRLAEVLNDPDPQQPFTHLTATNRQALREILPATKPDLQRVWEKIREAR